MTELLTLIDERAATAPMIDRGAFPNTPAEAFWTSSEFGGASGMAWQVYFDRGHGLYGLVGVQLRAGVFGSAKAPNWPARGAGRRSLVALDDL